MSQTSCPPLLKFKSLIFRSYNSYSGLLHYALPVLVHKEDKNLLLLSVSSLALVKGGCVANPNPLMFHTTFSTVLHGNFFSSLSLQKITMGL